MQVDTRKWAAARLAPKKYGDHVSHGVQGNPTLNFQPAVLIQVGDGPSTEVWRKIAFDERWTTDNMDLVRSNAASLVESNPDAIVAIGGRVIPILKQTTSAHAGHRDGANRIAAAADAWRSAIDRRLFFR